MEDTSQSDFVTGVAIRVDATLHQYAGKLLHSGDPKVHHYTQRSTGRLALLCPAERLHRSLPGTEHPLDTDECGLRRRLEPQSHGNQVQELRSTSWHRILA